MANQARRPSRRDDFQIAIICALQIEADAVEALFDNYWDGEPHYGKLSGDSNSYTHGSIGPHNVVLVHLAGMGKVHASDGAAHCRTNYPGIKLALVVGICGAVPSTPKGSDIFLGDVIVSTGVFQYDFGRQYPDNDFVPKEDLLETLGRPNQEIRAFINKISGFRGRRNIQDKLRGYLDLLAAEEDLFAHYPGIQHDRLFSPAYSHLDRKKTCEQCGCDEAQSSLRRQHEQRPVVHFGLVASGDKVMKSGQDRDMIAHPKDILGFEMEGAGVWEKFPCVVIKGVCDYADSHKMKAWQSYAAATAAACMKAFLAEWVPSPGTDLLPESWFILPYPKNEAFIGRTDILAKLQQKALPSDSQPRVSLFGIGGAGKTQVAVAFAYWLQETHPLISVFWVHASSAARFQQSYTSIAQKCRIPGYDNPKIDVLQLVKGWLESEEKIQWLMIIDNADDLQLFSDPPSANDGMSKSNENLTRYLPSCHRGAFLITTRNKQVGARLTMRQQLIEIPPMNDEESTQLLQSMMPDADGMTPGNVATLSARLEYLPLALAQGAAFIQATGISVDKYIEILDKGVSSTVSLLSKDFEAVGRDPETLHAVAGTWVLSFQLLQERHALASKLLSFMSLLDRQDIPFRFLKHYCQYRMHEAPQTEAASQTKNKLHVDGEIELIEAIGVLQAFSFIKKDKGESYGMHRLVQLVTRSWLESTQSVARFREAALFTLTDLFPYAEYETRAECAAYLSHANALLPLDKSPSREELKARAFLLHNIAAYLRYEGRYAEAEERSKQGVILKKGLYESDDPSLMASMGDLATIFSAQGRYGESEGLYAQMLEAGKDRPGFNHTYTLTVMHNLASTYGSQGRYEESERLQMQVLEARKKILGPDHPHTLSTMHNLASTYDSQGRYEESEGLQMQVLEARKKILGPDHPDTLTTMHFLALAYWNQGRFEESEGFNVQVLEARKKRLGLDHPDTLLSLSALALSYGLRGWYDEAEGLQVHVLEASKRILGPDHPETLESMHNLAFTYHGTGRISEAIDLMRKCVQFRQIKVDIHHPRMKYCLALLARWEGEITLRS